MGRLARVAAWYLVVIGIAHTLATPYFHPSYSLEAIWFASGGLCFAAVGLVNLALLRRAFRDPLLHPLALILNLGLLAVSASLSVELWLHLPSLLVFVAAGIDTLALSRRRPIAASS